MSKEIEAKLSKIPIINLLVIFGKKIKVPGLQGMTLYDLLELYIIGIVQGAVTTRAGGIAYSFFMAIFPFMLFMLTLIPYIPIEGFPEALFSLLEGVLPPSTFEAVDSVVIDVINNKQVGLLSFGFLASIFLMTNGVNAIFGGFEYSYHIKEMRNVVRAYFISMLVSIVMAVFLVVTVSLTVFYKFGLDALERKGWLENELLWLSIGRGVLFIIMIFVIVSILYKYGTKTSNYSRFFTPGSLLTTILYVLTFYLFSYYVTEFSRYNELYGSIGTLLILMLYVWLNSIILLLGFELNASYYSLKLKNKIFS